MKLTSFFYLKGEVIAMNNSGCYKCENRKVGCHIDCEIYKEYVKRKDVINYRRRMAEERYQISMKYLHHLST